MRYKQDLIQKHYELLPDSVKRFLGSEQTTDTIVNIGKKYNLHIDQLNILSEEVGLVLHGIEKSSDFTTNLRQYLGVPEDISNLITYDLNQQIFSKIREELSKLNSLPQQTFDSKMSGVTNVPKQEVEVKAQTEDNKAEEVPAKPPRDPYRESL